MLKCLAFLVVLLLPAVSWAQSSPCDSPLHWGQCRESIDRNASNKERAAKNEPTLVQIIRTDADEKESREHAHNESQLVDATWKLAIATGILAVGTIVLAVFTYKLWAATKRLVTDAKDTSQIELRPYVSIVGGYIYLTKDRKLLVHLDARNQGKIPAHEVRQFIDAEVRPFERDDPGTIGDVSADNWAMAPGTSWPLRFPDRVRGTKDGGAIVQDVPNDDITALANETHQLVSWGKITYRDGFSGTALRVSLFCYRNGRRMALSPEERDAGIWIKWEPEVCPEGNHST